MILIVISENIFSKFIELDNKNIEIILKNLFLIYSKNVKRTKLKYFLKFLCVLPYVLPLEREFYSFPPVVASDWRSDFCPSTKRIVNGMATRRAPAANIVKWSAARPLIIS